MTDTYTITDLERHIQEAFDEYKAEPWGDNWKDAVSELADNLTPVYFNDCFRLAIESTEISHFDIDTGLAGNDNYPARLTQIAVYEWIRDKLYQLFEADETS